MSLLSMTGFGAARAERALPDGAQLAVRAEIRTVNHKHLQSKVRLPQDYGVLEPVLDKLVRSKLARGSVQVSLDISRTGGAPMFDVDEGALSHYLDLQRKVAERHGIAQVDSVEKLLGLPGVIVQKRAAEGIEGTGPEAELVVSVMTEALAALVEMRGVEGDAMERDLRQSADAITSLVADVEDCVPDILLRHKARLLERVGELSGNTGVTEADLAREIALLADRLDVAEELARLKSHIDQLDGLLTNGGAVGRKLDFLAQEFFREANTIGSKCSDSAVAHLVVELKTQVERLREQVQNVE